MYSHAALNIYNTISSVHIYNIYNYVFICSVSGVITEVMCINMDQSCGNSRYFKCRQVKTKLQVKREKIIAQPLDEMIEKK